MELDCSGLMALPVVGQANVDMTELWGSGRGSSKCYRDDAPGKKVGVQLVLVQDAMAEEVREAEAMNVWTKMPRSEALMATGRAPVGTRRVDATKGDERNPIVRSRLVAQESRRESDCS